MSKPKFKIGDRVKVIGSSPYYRIDSPPEWVIYEISKHVTWGIWYYPKEGLGAKEVDLKLATINWKEILSK